MSTITLLKLYEFVFVCVCLLASVATWAPKPAVQVFSGNVWNNLRAFLLKSATFKEC